MGAAYDYIHQGGCYRYGIGWCRIRIYGGTDGDAPVVLCTDLPEGRGDEMVERLAAEVVRDRFGGRLPALPRPLLWIEHRPSRRNRGPGRYQLLTFPAYKPRFEGAGFVRRITLGTPSREELTPREVAVLTGEKTHGLKSFGQNRPRSTMPRWPSRSASVKPFPARLFRDRIVGNTE